MTEATRIQPAKSFVHGHGSLTWDRVKRTTYLIRQEFRYDYTEPVRDLRQRLMLIPPERHGDQRLISHRLEVSSQNSEMRREVDQFGNLVNWLLVDSIERAIDFTAWVVVERDATSGPVRVDRALRTDPRFLDFTPLTAPDAGFAAALDAIGPAPDEATLAERINRWLFVEMTYSPGTTGVATTAREAFAARRGVCQDYAQIMLGLLRLAGVPARYVSGHLLGEGGTHAWVEVLAPDPNHPARTVAVPFDPTHGISPGLSYVTVATGRDYNDVAPTSGSYWCSGTGTLTATKNAAVTDVEYLQPQG
ncbi:MAG: transglutaminase family protein [Thermomicrobiales bacterium]